MAAVARSTPNDAISNPHIECIKTRPARGPDNSSEAIKVAVTAKKMSALVNVLFKHCNVCHWGETYRSEAGVTSAMDVKIIADIVAGEPPMSIKTADHRSSEVGKAGPSETDSGRLIRLLQKFGLRTLSCLQTNI